jgi:hypothetical protein
MIYTFKCERCQWTEHVHASIKEGPPPEVQCICGMGLMQRDWKADAPMLDTSACRDHSEIRADKRVRSAWDGNQSPDAVESKFKQHVQRRRREIREAGGQQGSLKQTHAVPAHLYHGKIKETGDQNYWSDPKNLSRHNDCKVDE